MSRIVYDPVTFGGKLTAEFANDVIGLKAQAIRLNALLKETTNDGNNQELIEIGAANAPVFGVAAGSGHVMYVAISAIATALATISNDTLADLDKGG